MKYLILLIALASNAFSQINYCGDGSLYYCYTENYDGISYSELFQTRNDRYIRFSTALINLNKKISLAKKRLRIYSNKSKFVTILNNLKKTKTDVIKCRNGGFQGGNNPPVVDPNPAPTPGTNTHSFACSVIGNQTGNSRIISGARCEIGNSPVVYIDLGEGACTGTVVKSRNSNSKTAVIFAAHCLDNVKNVRINTPNGSMQANYFAKFPGYNTEATSGDIAIATFNQEIPTRAIHITANGDQRVGEQAIIGGFGVDENNNASPNQLKAGITSLYLANQNEVSTKYNSSTSVNTCFGDSGGPLLVNRNGQWELAAVTSNGQLSNCGIGDVSNYASLSNTQVKNWINSIVPGLIN